ncbi:hypothetical protein C0995_011174 [Termitomyces sp. Mi166|nr:hypothetical protein C0995_011174 [Termitomyces sp. Mi166\
MVSLSQPSSSLFALSIGINKYSNPSIANLHGAVHDANAAENYLISEDRIVNLRDEEATGEAILKALRDLAHNSAIHAQDPILIYYAGHGSEAPSPVSGARGRMLLPHDFGYPRSNAESGQGILDVTLSQILADIATSKSDNIVELPLRFISGFYH